MPVFSLAGCGRAASPALESVPSLACTARPKPRLQHQCQPGKGQVSKQASSRERENIASGHGRAIAAGNAATSYLANMDHPIMARICRLVACEHCVQSTASVAWLTSRAVTLHQQHAAIGEEQDRSESADVAPEARCIRGVHQHRAPAPPLRPPRYDRRAAHKDIRRRADFRDCRNDKW